MTAFQEQQFVVRESWAMDAPGRIADGVAHFQPPLKVGSLRRDRVGDGLARRVLAHLPLSVAVMDANGALSFWNEHASILFGIPPLMAAERPSLEEMLGRIGSLAQAQRDRIVAFAAAHVAAGDRTEPDGCLRLSLGRTRRIAIQMHGLGAGRWMLIFDDGKVTAAGNPAMAEARDAWLDFLTGLSNRRHFNEMLQEALDHATAETRQAVLLIDLDRFAPVNETFGQSVGDALLCLAAQRLRRETRDNDLLARLGGDEFALMIPNGDDAEALATRAGEILAEPFLIEGQRVTISASIGIVRFPEHGASVDVLLHHANLALYQAKSAGGRTSRLFDTAMATEARARQELETDLRKALTLGEFSLAYLPCGDVGSNALTGFEARPQWRHPVRGLVPDGVFLQLAEANGFIVELGEWVLLTACAEAADWPAPQCSSAEEPRPAIVVVRASPRQLREADRLVKGVKLALAVSGLAPERLELKVSEACLEGGDVDVISTLQRLHALGIRITLADCAIGPSLLTHLRSFSFQAVGFAPDPGSDVMADADQTSVRCALSAAGFEHVGCYFDDSLITTPEIAEMLQLQALSTNDALVTERECQAP